MSLYYYSCVVSSWLADEEGRKHHGIVWDASVYPHLPVRTSRWNLTSVWIWISKKIPSCLTDNVRGCFTGHFILPPLNMCCGLTWKCIFLWDMHLYISPFKTFLGDFPMSVVEILKVFFLKLVENIYSFFLHFGQVLMWSSISVYPDCLSSELTLGTLTTGPYCSPP